MFKLCSHLRKDLEQMLSTPKTPAQAPTTDTRQLNSSCAQQGNCIVVLWACKPSLFLAHHGWSALWTKILKFLLSSWLNHMKRNVALNLYTCTWFTKGFPCGGLCKTFLCRHAKTADWNAPLLEAHPLYSMEDKLAHFAGLLRIIFLTTFQTSNFSQAIQHPG